MDTEEFSFPALGNTSSRFIDSPPLWRMSPAASPDSYHQEKFRTGTEEDIDGDKNRRCANDCFASNKSCNQRKSFSYVKMVKGEHNGDHDNNEEKMDMLWEDFNEESSISHSSDMPSGEMIEMGCVQGLKLTKPVGTLLSHKKPSVVVLVKVLKKLLSLHTQRSPKKPT